MVGMGVMREQFSSPQEASSRLLARSFRFETGRASLRRR
jgi:hypothetical protein